MEPQIVTNDIVELAKTYFIKKEDGVNFEYVGPIGEYQKWYYVLHKEHKNKSAKEWRLNNIERDKTRSKIKGCIYSFINKLEVLRKVSGLSKPKCCNCGTTDIRVLTINHINGDGAKERKVEKNKVSRAYRDIKNGRTTLDLDVKCYNCNILYEYEQGRRSLPLNWKELYESGT